MAQRPFRARTATAVGLLALSLGLACGGGSTAPESVPTTIDVSPSSVLLDSIGDTQQLAATVRDQNGAAMSGATVTWASSSTTTVDVSESGLVTALATGSAQITASVGSITGQATVTVTPAARVVLVAGNNQIALSGYAVNIPPQVKVLDASGSPLAGRTVLFAVTGGGGSVTGGTVVTGANGVAEVGSWIVGGGANSLLATVQGTGIAGNPVPFSATGATQQYAIELRYITTPAQVYANAFTVARDRWQLLIFGDVPSVQVNLAANTTCGAVSIPSAINETVDDIVIYVDLKPIDGPGNVIGSAGPCYIRSTTGLPILGGMKFDTDDLDYLNTHGLLDETIIHEMGHVLGFGTIWTYSAVDLLRDPSDTSEGGTLGADTHFIGAQALWAFDRAGGAGYTGAKVPVENDYTQFESGSLDSHWRESVFGTELMTPLLNSGPGIENPLSTVTAAAMRDIGYAVNYAAADSYGLPGPAAVAAAAGAGVQVDLGHDVAGGPVYLVNAAGRVVGVIRR